VLTPARLREPATIATLAALRPGLLVLADYGRLVPSNLLALPDHGALNLHPSLLPRHRGATPIPAAILEGDAETGVTLIRMDEGIDTGPIVAQVATPIREAETAPELEARLATLGARLLLDALAGWLAGTTVARSQPAEGATLTRPLRREDGRLDPARGAALLERQVRAYQPWPGSWLDTERGRLVVWRARMLSRGLAGRAADHAAELIRIGDGVALTTSDGILELLEVQPEAARRMSADAWARGLRAPPRIRQDTAERPSGESAVG
jgi:methionyl-tRNA formyltransferase